MIPHTFRPPLVFTDASLAEQATSATPTKARRFGGPRAPRRMPGGWNRALPAAIVVIIIGAAVGIIVSTLHHSHTPSPTASSSHHPPGTTSPGTGTSSSTPSSSTTTTSTTTTLVVSGGSPVVSAIAPASGAAGATIALTGTGFASSNGTIFATFNGHPAPTRCPSEQQCTVTVPAGLSGSVVVRLKTARATSNAVSFQYT